MATIKLRSGTTSQWSSANPVLALGEPGFDSDLQLLRVGNGVARWTSLESYLTEDTLSAKLATDAPVTRYGAIGDGIADDTAALQAADNAAAAIATSSTRKGTVVVYFPAGNYRTTSTINKSPRTVWRGPGVRYIESATASRTSQGARIVSDHGGDAVTIRGTAGNGINQRGGIDGLQIQCANDASYPDARGLFITDDTREHFFANLQILGFKYSAYAKGVVGLRWYECYNSGATAVGLYMDNADECWVWNSQWAGAKYGGVFVNCGPLNGTGNRWQSSGTANLKMIQCSSVNLQGGFIDSASQRAPFNGPDRGYGLWLVNCLNVTVSNFLAYSNGPSAHARVESVPPGSKIDVDGTFGSGSAFSASADNVAPGQTGCANISVAGMFVPGAGATPVAVEFARVVGTTMTACAIGGHFSGNISPFRAAADAGGVDYDGAFFPQVAPSPGAPMRTAHDIFLVASADSLRNIGSAGGRWNCVVANRHQVFGIGGAANPHAQVDSDGLKLGAGGASPLDTGLARRSAGVVKVTNGGSGGGALATGASPSGERPSAVAVGPGAQWYDATLSKPIWSDGATWRDAAGTAV